MCRRLKKRVIGVAFYRRLPRRTHIRSCAVMCVLLSVIIVSYRLLLHAVGSRVSVDVEPPTDDRSDRVERMDAEDEDANETRTRRDQA